MAEACQRDAWEHTAWITANLMSAIVNANPFRDGPPIAITPAECNPYTRSSDAHAEPSRGPGITCTRDNVRAIARALASRKSPHAT